VIKSKLTLNEKSLQIIVTGLVQGVGFRPFVFRIASRLGLTGWVKNTNENVIINISGPTVNITSFLLSLKEEAPPAAIIHDISTSEIEPINTDNFQIL
jgi:hydrogenase maturation protein HypF